LVDDESDSREVLHAILSQYGARVKNASSAQQALGLMESEPFDVLVSDIAMPQVDGYELIRKVRSNAGATMASDIPAIALTAYARQSDRNKALRVGYDRHLAKPVQPARLITEILALTRG
jgi:CheY-like chemotaxis protein